MFSKDKRYLDKLFTTNITPPELQPLTIKNNLGQIDREMYIIKVLQLTYINWGFMYQGYGVKNIPNALICPLTTDVIAQIDNIQDKFLLRLEPGQSYNIPYISQNIMVIITDDAGDVDEFNKYILGERIIYIRDTYTDHKLDITTNGIVTTDNLIHILFMVKNGGDEFKDTLSHNLQYADKITILDTGSTDNTLGLINELVNENKHNKIPQIDVYTEPFTNFRDSRNRLFELTDNTWKHTQQDLLFPPPFIPVYKSENKVLDIPVQQYSFKIVLDDTYYLHGNIRNFLSQARGDTNMESFSIYIKEPDMTYSSNRITRPELGLRYKYRIHEIITPNNNALIPYEDAYIVDKITRYMKNRTTDRKVQDLIWLFEELDENPEDPRIPYYIAETYICVQDWENAYKYYNLRVNYTNKGYKEECYDAYYKRAVLAHLYLNKTWEECLEYYQQACEYEPLRPEAFYMLGDHYVKTDKQLAYTYFKQAENALRPVEFYNMNVKLDMYNWYLPKSILPLCLGNKDFSLGLKIATRMKGYTSRITDDNLAENWYDIFMFLTHDASCDKPPIKQRFCKDKNVVFIAPGGWDKWDGETLRTRGLGGSETCVIRFAEEISKTHNMIVFCKCNERRIYNNVYYIPLEQLFNFIHTYVVDMCFVHRYTEYIPLIIENKIPCYTILHDLTRENEIFCDINEYFKGIITLGEFHKQYVLDIYPQFENHIHTLSYGIDIEDYTSVGGNMEYRFIYPSFPNRGLYYLLKIFPYITDKYPNTILDIFCRFDLEYVRNSLGDDIIQEMQDIISTNPNIINHGWVDYHTLRGYWRRADIWLYPCTFIETCCRTAMEAAASRTLAITNDLGALKETVGDRGIVIPGEVHKAKWQNETINIVLDALGNIGKYKHLLDKNYNWAQQRTYENVVQDFVNKYILY